jgi:DNA-binding CsgD family transcriptional regulator
MNNLNPNSSVNKVNALDPTQILKEETEKVGIDFLVSFGIRYFPCNGDVFILTTDSKWSNIAQKKESISDARQHYCEEIRFINKHNLKYIIRSKEFAHTSLLKDLAEAEMCNAIGVYVKNQLGITVYFFTAHYQEKDAIQFLINKFHLLEIIISRVESRLLQLNYWAKSLVLPDNKNFFSTPEKLLIFGKKKRGATEKYYISVDKKQFQFKQKEMEILQIIGISSRTKDMAKVLDTDIRTIDWHLQNLRKELGVSARSSIITFAQKIENQINYQSSREFLYKNSLSHHRTSVVAYGGFILIFRKLLLKREQANSFEPN